MGQITRDVRRLYRGSRESRPIPRLKLPALVHVATGFAPGLVVVVATCQTLSYTYLNEVKVAPLCAK
jgi:hypothetical protein